jgi:hypothetical protein
LLLIERSGDEHFQFWLPAPPPTNSLRSTDATPAQILCEIFHPKLNGRGLTSCNLEPTGFANIPGF